MSDEIKNEEIEGTDSIKLSKPFNGKEEIVFDFNKITGAALLKCETKARQTDKGMVVPQLSMTFQAHVAAAAAGLKYDEIINLPGSDFMAVISAVSNFLAGSAR